MPTKAVIFIWKLTSTLIAVCKPSPFLVWDPVVQKCRVPNIFYSKYDPFLVVGECLSRYTVMLAIDRLATMGISLWEVFMFQVAVRAHLCLFRYLSRQVPYAFTLTSLLVEPLLIRQRTRSDVYMLSIASFSPLSPKLVNFEAVWFPSFRGGLLSALWTWQTVDLCTLLVV